MQLVQKTNKNFNSRKVATPKILNLHSNSGDLEDL